MVTGTGRKFTDIVKVALITGFVLTLFIYFPGKVRNARAVDLAAVLEKKMKYERILEENLRSVLVSFMGTENITVIVIVTPDTEEVVSEVWEKVKIGDGGKGGKKTKKSKYLLPGVPVKTELGTDTGVVVEEDVDTKTTYKKSVRLPDSLIKKLSVKVLLDEKIDEKRAGEAESLAEEVLSIDYKRGDTLKITRIAFAVPELPPEPELSRVDSLIKEIEKFPPYITWTAALLILFMFAFFPIRFFTRGLMKVFQATPPRETKVNIAGNPQVAAQGGGVLPGMGAENPGGGQPAERPREVERIIVEKRVGGRGYGGEEEEDLTNPFNYIDAGNLNHLIYLMQKETPENISMLIAYLDPGFSKQILASLPSDKKSEVTGLLATAKEISPVQLSAINKEIKKKIDFIVDGTDRLSAILDQSDKATRDEIFEFLKKKDPELAERIRKSIFTFENVMYLSTDDLQRVLREVNLDILGEALRDVSDEFRETIYGKISEGAASMIKQEIELGRDMPQKKIEDAQHHIVGVVRKLEKQGEIEIKKKEEGEEEAAPVPEEETKKKRKAK